MVFENLDLTTPRSHLIGYLNFNYNREDLQFFEDKVQVDAVFKESTVALDELNVLYDEFGKNQVVQLNTRLSGTLNNLDATNLYVSTSKNTVIDGQINFKNLFNAQENNFVMDGTFNNLSSNYRDLTALLPNVLGRSIPTSFKNLGNFKMTGTSRITTTKINADLDIETGLGYVITNLELDRIDNIDNASYKGNVVLDEFDLGALVNDPLLGRTSLNVDVDGVGFTIENINTELEGAIYNIDFNNYNYSLSNVSGHFENKVFNGALESEEVNLKMNFDGLVDFSNPQKNVFDFKANVKHANLRALQIVTRDSLSLFSGKVTMNMQGKTIDDVAGDIKFENTLYKNENSDYYFKDFAVTSKFNNDVRKLTINSPEIVQGTLEGKFKFANVLKLVENSVGSCLLYTSPSPRD